MINSSGNVSDLQSEIPDFAMINDATLSPDYSSISSEITVSKYVYPVRLSILIFRKHCIEICKLPYSVLVILCNFKPLLLPVIIR